MPDESPRANDCLGPRETPVYRCLQHEHASSDDIEQARVDAVEQLAFADQFVVLTFRRVGEEELERQTIMCLSEPAEFLALGQLAHTIRQARKNRGEK